MGQHGAGSPHGHRGSGSRAASPSTHSDQRGEMMRDGEPSRDTEVVEREIGKSVRGRSLPGQRSVGQDGGGRTTHDSQDIARSGQ